ncbi:MAG: DUF1622 domain-containing protein [Coriobacteriales bacterium]|nr:DUF1622 domain-containing protein [Coriobacteriales bacterium]
MSFDSIMEGVTIVFEGVGVGILVVGGVYAVGRYVMDLQRGMSGEDAYRGLRDSLGRTILLALEILVMADIIRTLAVDPTLANVGVLGLIVLIRTFLSFSLEIEIDGAPPWRRAQIMAGRSKGDS